MISSGQDLILAEKDAGDFNIDFQIPANNIGAIPDDVGDIFPTDSWDTTSTDIVTQFLRLAALSERTCGLPPAVAWINSQGLSRLYNNTKIASLHGTARRVFDLQSGRQIATIPSGRRSSGYLVKFDVIPQIDFIVYDGTSSPGTDVDSTDSSSNSKFIPDGKMIVTPAPGGDWVSLVEGGEIVREHKADMNPQKRWGFYAWQEPMTQPSGRELIAVDWLMPYLTIPSSVYYVSIYTP